MEDLVVAGLTIPGDELAESFTTPGGPGGQHANRNETAVRLRFDIAESTLPDRFKSKLMMRLGPAVEVSASDERSQHRNRERARQRMAEKLEVALREVKPRKKTKPTKASRNRRLNAKKARSEKKKRRRRPSIED